MHQKAYIKQNISTLKDNLKRNWSTPRCIILIHVYFTHVDVFHAYIPTYIILLEVLYRSLCTV